MSNIDEIKALESQLRLAELGPDPAFFERALADDAVLDGQQLKAKVVAAHQPNSKAPKFTKVEMSDYNFVDQGQAVVVTCVGKFESAKWSGALQFMRVWLKSESDAHQKWKIIAGSTAPKDEQKDVRKNVQKDV